MFLKKRILALWLRSLVHAAYFGRSLRERVSGGRRRPRSAPRKRQAKRQSLLHSAGSSLVRRHIERLEDRTLLSPGLVATAASANASSADPNAALRTAVPLGENATVQGSIDSAIPAAVYAIKLDADGTLTATLTTAVPRNLTLQLLDSQRRLLTDSAGDPQHATQMSLRQFLTQGSYFVRVASVNATSHETGFVLETTFITSSSPLKPLRPSDGKGGTATGQVVAEADVNGDGRPDVIVGTVGGGVVVFLNLGDGTFSEPTNVPLTGRLETLAVADLNGDGFADIVNASRYSDGTTHLVLSVNDGSGTFQPSVPVETNLEFDSVDQIVAARLEGDGPQDLVVAGIHSSGSTSGHQAVILHNAGNGDFAPIKTLFTPDGGISRSTVIVSDLDGDGRPDLVLSYYFAYSSRVLFNDGQGGFSTQVVPGQVELAVDLNGDGIADLVVLQTLIYTEKLAVSFGTSGRTFAAPVDLPPGTFSGADAAASDLTGDGYPDLILTNSGSSVQVLRNRGGGAVCTAAIVSCRGCPPFSPGPGRHWRRHSRHSDGQ